MLGPQGEGDNARSVPTSPLLPGGPGSNVSSRLEAQPPKGQNSPGGCACPGQASPAPRAAAPPRAAHGPTPRTEEAAWAAMALTFLLVLLTLATLCTRLHRNFRRGESIYWEPTVDSRDTVAGETRPSSPTAPPPGASRPLTAPPSAHSCAEAEAADAPSPGQALPPETPPPAHARQRPGRGQLRVTCTSPAAVAGPAPPRAGGRDLRHVARARGRPLAAGGSNHAQARQMGWSLVCGLLGGTGSGRRRRRKEQFQLPLQKLRFY